MSPFFPHDIVRVVTPAFEEPFTALPRCAPPRSLPVTPPQAGPQGHTAAIRRAAGGPARRPSWRAGAAGEGSRERWEKVEDTVLMQYPPLRGRGGLLQRAY